MPPESPSSGVGRLRKLLIIATAAVLMPLLGGVGWISYMVLYHRHDHRTAMRLQANAQVIGFHAVRSVVKQRTPFLRFDRTREAWAKVCGRQDSLCGEPEGLAYAGKWIFVIVPVVALADAAAAVVTVPLDIMESPFRERPIQSISVWTVSGTLEDRSHHPMPGVDLRVVYGFESGASGKLAGMANATTNDAGSFQASVSAIESIGWKNSFRLDPGHLVEIECDATQDDCR